MPPLAAAMVRATKTVLADNFVGLGLLQSASYKKSIPTHEKLFAVGKAAQMPLLTSFLLGWVGLGSGSSSVS